MYYPVYAYILNRMVPLQYGTQQSTFWQGKNAWGEKKMLSPVFLVLMSGMEYRSVTSMAK